MWLMKYNIDTVFKMCPLKSSLQHIATHAISLLATIVVTVVNKIDIAIWFTLGYDLMLCFYC